MEAEITLEARQALDFFASTPVGETTLSGVDFRSFLEASGGYVMSLGRLYRVKSEHLGEGVYQVSLTLANP